MILDAHHWKNTDQSAITRSYWAGDFFTRLNHPRCQLGKKTCRIPMIIPRNLHLVGGFTLFLFDSYFSRWLKHVKTMLKPPTSHCLSFYHHFILMNSPWFSASWNPVEPWSLGAPKAVVQGDTHGVIASKMALGMLVPMSLGDPWIPMDSHGENMNPGGTRPGWEEDWHDFRYVQVSELLYIPSHTYIYMYIWWLWLSLLLLLHYYICYHYIYFLLLLLLLKLSYLFMYFLYSV